MFYLGDLGWDGAGNGVEVAELGEVFGAVVTDVQAGWCCGVGLREVGEGGGCLGLDGVNT